jgi:2-aminoethylphosphonate-pyruvate transaminase
VNYPCDHLAGSANKCIEGVPGFAFVISRRTAMEEAAGRARSLCLDLHAQWKAFEGTGKFRFTPPTHVLLAFRQALRELEKEGGMKARARRYANNRDVLIRGMTKRGFQPFLAPQHRSHIITTFRYPRPDFDFPDFYRRLKKAGYIIYPGKLTGADTFRVGTIGSIGPRQMAGFLRAVSRVCK